MLYQGTHKYKVLEWYVRKDMLLPERWLYRLAKAVWQTVSDPVSSVPGAADFAAD